VGSKAVFFGSKSALISVPFFLFSVSSQVRLRKKFFLGFFALTDHVNAGADGHTNRHLNGDDPGGCASFALGTQDGGPLPGRRIQRGDGAGKGGWLQVVERERNSLALMP
jgi:hypothetical protein